MKKILLLAVIFLSLTTFSQSTRQYLGLSIGPSFPLSDFAKTDISDSTSGFAKTGVNFKFIYSYRITHNFGIQAHFVYNSNNLDIQALSNEASKEFPSYSFSTESKQGWSTGGIYAGPFLRFPFTDKLSWEIRGLIGLSGGYSPQFTIRGTNTETGEKTEYYREFSRTYGLGLSAGSGFKYRVKNYLVLLNADYYYSDLTFNEVTGWGWTDDENLTGTPYNFSTQQKVNNIAVTIGFAYFL